MSYKTVIITGGARGIGREIAIEFAKNNYDVMITYNNSYDQAIKLNLEYGINFRKLDVSQIEDIDNFFNYFFSKFNRLDVIVNNAAISNQKLFTDISYKDLNNIFHTNFYSVFFCSQWAAKHMIKQKHGKIINISSIWGLVGGSMETHYSASKAAIIGFTKSLAKELALSNINVNCVAPGIIRTDMLSNFSTEEVECMISETPLNRLGLPNDISKLVYFLASSSSNFITGQVISPNGGLVI